MPDDNDVSVTTPPPEAEATGEDNPLERGSRKANDEELDRKPNKWAGLGYRYQYHRDKLRDNRSQQGEGEDKDEDERTSERSPRLLYRLADSLDRVDNRLHSHKQTITDIETKPDVKTSSPEAAAASEHRVERVRFELDNDEYTHWYSWEPQNPDHPLTHIIDYYADGDLSRLHNTTVDIAYDTDTLSSFGPSSEIPRILYPVPYDRRSGHLKYRLLKPLLALDNPNETTFTRTDATSERSTRPEITENTRYHTRLSATMWSYIGSFCVLVGLGILASTVTLQVVTGVSERWALLLTAIGFIFMLSVTPAIMGVIPEDHNDVSESEMYTRAVMLALLPLVLVVWGMKRWGRVLWRKLHEFDKRDSV